MARKPLTSEQANRVVRVDGSIVRARPSEQEMHERRLFVRQLIAAGMHSSAIVEQAVVPQQQADGSYKARFDCTGEAIRRIIAEIREEFRREQEIFAPTDRATALARLYTDLVNLRSELQIMRSAAVKNYGAIRAHVAEVRNQEKLIAEMEGTLKPVKVEHTHGMSDALVRVISTMTKDQTEQAILEEKQRLLDRGSITTSSEEVQDAPRNEALENKTRFTHPRSGQPVQTPRQQARVDSAPQARPSPAERSTPRPLRSSDIAARRESGHRDDEDVGGRARHGVVGARVIG